MKKILSIACLFAFACMMVSCLAPNAYRLNWDAVLIGPVQSDLMKYSDDDIDLSFRMGQKQISFLLVNKTPSGVKINWDELAFVGLEGRSMRVIHSGVRLMDRNAPQASTTVPPNSNLNDMLIPSENIYYISGRYGGWNEHDLFYAKDQSELLGKEFSVYFPLQVKGEKKELTFRFKISHANMMN